MVKATEQPKRQQNANGAAKQPREHFIPLRKSELVDLLCRDPGTAGTRETDKEQFRRLAQLLSATFHFEYHQRLETLKDAYAPFDPDADTLRLSTPGPDEKRRLLAELMGQFTWLLERANFRRLTRADIQAAMQGASAWGINLKVDFDVFDELEIFCRGEVTQTRPVPRTPLHWLGLSRRKEATVDIFQRLVLILRLRPGKHVPAGVDTDSVHIKVFKDIPKVDLEMLLPGTRVDMRLTDRLKLGFSLSTGIGVTGYKIAAPLLGLVAGAAGAGATSTTAMLGVAGGAFGYGMRSFYGYVQTKQKYQLTLAQSLYFLNLDNNAGVLFRLLDEAEEQECREALLAWHWLWRNPRDGGWAESEVDAGVEKYLRDAAGVEVDFEVGDALAKLRRLRLVDEPAPGRLRAVPPAAALESLDRAWDHYFTYNRHLAPVA